MLNENMTADDVLRLIRFDADKYELSAADALPALTEILAEQTGKISVDDFTTLIAIGSVLYRQARPKTWSATPGFGLSLSPASFA